MLIRQLDVVDAMHQELSTLILGGWRGGSFLPVSQPLLHILGSCRGDHFARLSNCRGLLAGSSILFSIYRCNAHVVPRRTANHEAPRPALLMLSYRPFPFSFALISGFLSRISNDEKISSRLRKRSNAHSKHAQGRLQRNRHRLRVCNNWQGRILHLPAHSREHPTWPYRHFDFGKIRASGDAPFFRWRGFSFSSG